MKRFYGSQQANHYVCLNYKTHINCYNSYYFNYLIHTKEGLMNTIVILVFIFFSFNGYAKPPNLLLSKAYHSDIAIEDYWISEKLDGVRAYWDGANLISRQGHTFNAPQWFTAPLPNLALDGELWIKRNQFDKVSGLVRRRNSSNWQSIKYMIFDLPNSKAPFDSRVKTMVAITQISKAPHFQAIKQFKLKTHQQLMLKLDDIIHLGGEGLMLHKGSSYYKSGRSNDLLKLKKHLDAEATVIKHFEGKGKFKNMLGAILVETKDQVRFKIGSGFSHEERKNPPPIGSLITYKYFGLTSKGKPRFASFIRIREGH